MSSRLLRRREVETITGLSRSTIYLKMDNDDFPRPVDLGARSVAWVESEVNAWIEDRVAKRDIEAA